MKKETLLIYAHYYYPDVASTGQILKELAEGLKDIFEVTVICVVPSYDGKVDPVYQTKKVYKENINGVKVLRVRVPEFSKGNKKSRLINMFHYFYGAVRETVKLKNQTYIFTISQPPILGGVLGVIGKTLKRGKLIYTIQDFNPEQAAAVKYSKNQWILNTALKVDSISCRNADQIIVVGRDMQETLFSRLNHKKVPPVRFINNWIDEKAIFPLPSDDPEVMDFKQKYKLDGKFVIAYSGNLGLYYDLENLLSVIEKFKDVPDVVFAFIGDGTVKENLVRYQVMNKLANIVFIPYQEKEKLVYSLNAGDVHWVVNAKGIKGISVPSKLYGVMAVGKPVIGVLEEGSEARCLIEESGCGMVIDPEDYEAIEETIRYVLTHKSVMKEMGPKGREYLERHLTKDRSIDKYAQTIQALGSQQVMVQKG